MTLQEELDATDALADDMVRLPDLEEWALRLEVLADAYDEGDITLPGLRQHIADLRRAPEWRAERDAEFQRTKPGPRVEEAAALAASCWADEPVRARLRRIEEVQRRLGDLAEQARAEDAFEDVMAIGEYATSVWRLRGALEGTSDAGDEKAPE
ncbi:MAG: hypothetical protein J2P38_01150 [Candidatus Dormibacteraeota bacterium]|nr:hypothetical protein [Candidatus Dormibacteraeota bacterium]